MTDAKNDEQVFEADVKAASDERVQQYKAALDKMVAAHKNITAKVLGSKKKK